MIPSQQDAPLMLHGEHTVADLAFLEVEPPDPLGVCGDLRLDGRPYALWLTDAVLRPVLERWSHGGAAGRTGKTRVREDFAAAASEARLAFARVLPAATALGEPAVLAALGVTANLLRTLALLAEFILDDRPRAARAEFRLSRRWAGLLEYPPSALHFPAGVRRPARPVRPRPNRRDPRHLCNALWCSPAAVKTRCAEAIDQLKREIRRERARSGE